MMQSKQTQLLALSLMVSMITSPVMAANFYDTQGHWASNSIERLSGANLLGGYPNGSFKPESSITRAEFATVLSKALNLPLQQPRGLFRDVPRSHWAAPAIEAVKRAGVISGYPNGTFGPGKNISRAEMMVTLASAANLQPLNQEETESTLTEFSDTDSIPNWAKPSIAAAIDAELVQPQPNLGRTLQPTRNATRADVAYFTDNYLTFAGDNPLGINTNSYANNNASNTPIQGYVSVIPAETTFKAMLQTPISSENVQEGSEISLILPEGLSSSNSNGAMIPASSRVIGRVIEVEPAGFTGRDGAVELRFDRLILPDGRQLPLSASVATKTGELRAGSTAGRIGKAAGKTAIGAAAGAALGTALGPLSGGSVGKGAIYGTAVGAGAGAVAAAASKGKPLILNPGEQIELKLDQALNLEGR